MKRFIATAIASLSITTAPAYGQTPTALALYLGEYQGVFYCAALNHGVRTQREMVEALTAIEDPKLDQMLYQYDAWKRSGDQALLDVMFESTFNYAYDNCPVLYRRYLEENR